jgi:hypothetical protein
LDWNFELGAWIEFTLIWEIYQCEFLADKIPTFIHYRMAKTIVDALLGLTLDDSPSNLAAATLFHILTSDVSCFCS